MLDKLKYILFFLHVPNMQDGLYSVVAGAYTARTVMSSQSMYNCTV